MEIVKRVSGLMERRDWAGMADVVDPDVELHGTVGGLEEGKILRGHAQIIEAFDRETEEAWDEHRIEPQEFLDVGDRVLILHREYHRSKSGVEIAVDTASIHDVHEGRIVRIQGYMDPAEALKAAGLRK
ncbi:MAG: SnoaL-like polyketide cyclase [Solirubrobacterales bacterium]|nr:SnoaL-like polyketide cyclase [Solirubrobacterales bacterium]